MTGRRDRAHRLGTAQADAPPRAAFVGVSDRTAGATGICMNVVQLAPGAAATPHAHVGFETAIR